MKSIGYDGETSVVLAITLGSLISIKMNMVGGSGVNLNEWTYQVDGSAFLVNAVQIAEAWWNDVKGAYRGVIPSAAGNTFVSASILELNNPAGDYGEYSVPLAERVGTRSSGPEPQFLPPFAAVGVRLTVGTRVTRPGQKRFGFMVESDQNNGLALASVLTPVDTLMANMTEPIILGAPAATITLIPIVCRRDASGFVTAHQEVLGWVTNPYITSQNSRKFGHGN